MREEYSAKKQASWYVRALRVFMAYWKLYIQRQEEEVKAREYAWLPVCHSHGYHAHPVAAAAGVRGAKHGPHTSLSLSLSLSVSYLIDPSSISHCSD
jgi:hypothetical protein